jgi:hypothetical protein
VSFGVRSSLGARDPIDRLDTSTNTIKTNQVTMFFLIVWHAVKQFFPAWSMIMF